MKAPSAVLRLASWNELTEETDSSQYTSLWWTTSLDWIKNLGDDEVAVVYLSLYETGATAPDSRSHHFNMTMPAGGYRHLHRQLRPKRLRSPLQRISPQLR